MTNAQTLHVRCGTDIQGALEQASIEGAFFEYSDPYCRGPVPPDPEARFSARLDYIVERWGRARDETRRKLEGFRALHQHIESANRVVLWFEHDLYDQTILWELLADLQARPDLRERCELVSTDSVDGVENFRGFGQLSPEQLAVQLEGAVPVTPLHCTQATALWRAFCAPDPAALRAWPGSDALPYARRAIERHLAEFPGETDGLSLTQRLALQAARDGAGTPAQIFVAVLTQTDPLPFLGDSMFFADLAVLRDAPQPALTPWDGVKGQVSLTDFGHALLGGAAHWVERNGIDEWRGGVHLQAEPQVPYPTTSSSMS